MHAMTALLAFGLLNSPAPLLRTSQRSPPQRWARYPPAPVAQLVASDEDDTVRSQSSVPELPVLKPLLPESPSHPEPILPEPVHGVPHVGPIDVNTLALPEGIELPKPVELPQPPPEPPKVPTLRGLATFCLPAPDD